MDSEEKKIIEELKNELWSLEIPYEEGNWENFKKVYGIQIENNSKKKRLFIFRSWKFAQAAAILIGILIYCPKYLEEGTFLDENRYTFYQNTSFKPKLVTKESQLLKPTISNEFLGNISLENKMLSDQNAVFFNDTISEEVSTDEVKMQTEMVKEVLIEQPLIAQSTNKRKEEYTVKNNYLANLDDNLKKSLSTINKWRFGAEFNSSLTSDKLNFAAGIITQYEVLGKVKLATGLGYSNLSGIHQINSIKQSYNTKIIGGETRIQALDIPISVVYESKVGWYASVGISALAVLQESKVYQIETTKLNEKKTIDPVSGAKISVFELTKSEYKERSNELDFEGRNNLGYLNLSIGKKQQLNKQLDLLFEPFVRIPMGGLQHKDINFLSSGIKIKVLF